MSNWSEAEYREFMYRRLRDEARAREVIRVKATVPVEQVQAVLDDPEHRAEAAALGWPVEDMKNAVEKAKKNENNRSMGAVPDTERQRDNRQAMGDGVSNEKGREKRLVYRVHIISVRSRLLDGDNLTTGAKFLRDAIAESLGLDDAEGAGIEFEYSQCLTRGEQGTIVKIEQV